MLERLRGRFALPDAPFRYEILVLRTQRSKVATREATEASVGTHRINGATNRRVHTFVKILRFVPSCNFVTLT